MSQPKVTPLTRLASFEQRLRYPRSLYVLLQIVSLGCLWAWFYYSAGWVSSFVIDGLINTAYLNTSLILIFFYTVLRVWAVNQRKHLAKIISRMFYERFFDELMVKRWALIRSKPITAWQDVTFRHVPAIEKYLIDYQTQSQLLLIVPIIILLVVFPLSWLIGVTLLLTLPLIPLFMWLVGTGTATMQRKHMLALNRLGAFFADRIQGQRMVRIFAEQHSQLAAFERVSEQHNRRMAEVIRIAFLSTSVLDFFATVSVALVAVFIGFSLLGEITFGFSGGTPSLHHGFFLLLLAPAFFNEFKMLGKLYHVKAEATASTEQWQHTLQWQQAFAIEIEKPLSFQKLQLIGVEIRGFEGTTLITTDNLSLIKGDRIQLMGASGAGKTVLFDALAGLRQTAGQLILNNVEVSTLSALQSKVFYLEQNPVFFAGSVRDNLSLGEIDDGKVTQAILDVGLGDWFARLPEGLDTPFDEHTNLSGGQKQKLALARIIIFDIEIVLLDEPFAHLTASEQDELFALLVRVTQLRTSIWISHRALPSEPFNKHWLLSPQGMVNEVMS